MALQCDGFFVAVVVVVVRFAVPFQGLAMRPRLDFLGHKKGSHARNARVRAEWEGMTSSFSLINLFTFFLVTLLVPSHQRRERDPPLTAMMERLTIVAFALIAPKTSAFLANAPSSEFHAGSSRLYAKTGGQGFGSDRGGGNGFGVNEKTYGASASAPIKDVIDAEGAMKEFFESNDEWSPLFRSIAQSASAPAMSFLGGTHGEEIDFSQVSTPWRRLQEIPSDDLDRTVLASFLDSMQQSLIDIPVNEAVKEDENDLHFIEEGRRMLAISRFQVLRENSGGSVQNFDSLFMTCWSELALLTHLNEANTGSLILLPDYDFTDLRRFTDMNLQRPLEWLGMSDIFEVASMQRESPAIRLLHKLADMPEDSYEEEV